LYILKIFFNNFFSYGKKVKMSVQRKNKTPTRTKMPSPKSSGLTPQRIAPKTPILKNIGETMEAVKEAVPAGGIATLGLTPEMIAPFVESQGLLRALLMILMFAVFLICVLLWAFGGSDSKAAVNASSVGNKVPGYIFNAWFVFLFLCTSMLGFGYIILHVSYMSAPFVVSCFIYLISLVLIFLKLYYSASIGSSAIQIWSFILIVNSFFFSIVTMQYTQNYLLCVAAVLPTVIFGGFTLYAGGLIGDAK
jgi:hypothetical protein